MPGTENGVDIYPGTPRPLDYPKYAKRLKDHGTALRTGESAIVTKIKVKSKHIEFQLDGGGYGTMGDETSANVNTAETPKTTREKNLEAEFKRETDRAKRRTMQEELDDLKIAREREDARNRAAVAEAGLLRKGMLLQEVDAMLGPAATTAYRKEGTLSVRIREYVTPDGKVTADFVEGVLVRYTMKSE